MTVTKHQCNGVDSVTPGTFSVNLPIPIPHNLVGFSSIHFSPLSLRIYPMPLLPGPFPISPGPGNVPGLSVFLALLVTFSSSSQDYMPPHLLLLSRWSSSHTRGPLKSHYNHKGICETLQGPLSPAPSNALGDDNSIIHEHGGGEQK